MHRWGRHLIIAVLAVVLVKGLSAADAPEPVPVSNYAPAEDLLAQAEFFMERLADSLESADSYTIASKARVQKDANTMIVLLMGLGLHDQDNRVKSSAPALVAQANKVAESYDDYQAAKTAFDGLAEGFQNGATGGEPLEWKPYFALGQVMKQVTLINNRLRLGLREGRFERTLEDSAGYSATLGLIGQVAVADTHEVKDEANLPQWYGFATEMRDAAGAVNKAVHDKDLAAATAAFERLNKNCNDCHAVFRKDLL
jgi:hypothetical protein